MIKIFFKICDLVIFVLLKYINKLQRQAQNYHDFTRAIRMNNILWYLQQLWQDMEIAVLSIGDEVPVTANRLPVCCLHLELIDILHFSQRLVQI